MRLTGLGAYVATKAAVSALTRNAALDHIHEGIRINAVSPGPIETPMSYRPGETQSDRNTTDAIGAECSHHSIQVTDAEINSGQDERGRGGAKQHRHARYVSW